MKISSRGIQIKWYTVEILFVGAILMVAGWFLSHNYDFPENLEIFFYIVGFVLIVFSGITIILSLIKRWKR